jgi:phosphoglycolate phosphatase-like HAD superfamily hydrolase
LLSVVRDRAGQKYQAVFDETNTFYIGDSPRDVAAAKTGGARSIAVASGRSTVTELSDAGPDAVLTDLSDPAALLRLLIP